MTKQNEIEITDMKSVSYSEGNPNIEEQIKFALALIGFGFILMILFIFMFVVG